MPNLCSNNEFAIDNKKKIEKTMLLLQKSDYLCILDISYDMRR